MADLRPPRDIQPLLDRFVEVCSNDDGVVAAFLGGSRGRREADAYSDVDLCVIAKADAYEALVADRAGFVARLGTPLFFEDFGFANLVFFVLPDGTECELFFGSEGRLVELEPGPTIRPLFDPGGILEGVAFAEERTDPREQHEVLRQILSWFWHELSHFISAMGRGELWWAAGQLESLRGHCVNLVRIEHGVFAGEEPYEKLDRTIDPAALSPIAGTFVPMERDALLRAARELVRFYTEKAPGVAEENGATYPLELAELMVKRLDDLGGTR
ncbi:MAG: nucleotidyltransferase domain-containing protein [Actinomycetota bacterium]